ncbi:response regulator [Planktothrix sp. FACHB-1375]|uniref:histidine kinase n=4 Tax=Oscillatoriophycideae TaxID=1301283 RepID=A0A926VED1_9CYAN|nr:response regulator [Aerosakkonema funiforme FACHB-1375]
MESTIEENTLINKLIYSHKVNILVVDDCPNNLRVLSSILTQNGYIVRKALDGEIAISACQKILPDLILLDIMMPNMDGYQLCQYFKQNEKTRHIPIIFISALDDVLDKVKAFNSGGADYISKPFEVKEVLARVTNQLTIRQLYNALTEQNIQLQKLNEELRIANAELEQFAYIASHDLKSPLQSIIGYTQLISCKYEKDFAPDHKRYLEHIVNAAWRMKRLIDDLLDYSKLGKETQELELTDCQNVLEEALDNLREEINSSGATITHSPLPKLMGDRTQLISLFQNLISNGIKFRRPQVIPEIKILAQLKNSSEWLFGVQDNGIGIEPQYFERIFEIFQRLHSYREYPGNGIGMTICKKIVERHGGSIWVESQVNKGTTFYFTIPSQ